MTKRLTKREMELIQGSVLHKAFIHGCALCGSMKFNASDLITRLRCTEINGKPALTEIPCVSIMCNECGHIHLFGAKHLGLVDDD